MDYIKVLEVLTGQDKKNADLSEKKDPGEILEKAFSFLSENVQTRIKAEIKEENENIKISQEYLYTILFVLKDLEKRDLTIEENLLSVSQYQTIKKSIGIAAAIGIAPCLLPGIVIKNTSTYSQFSLFVQETLTIMQKYERLSDTSRVFSDSFYNLSLRPVLLPHLGSLFAGLLQLSFAPLKKPEADCDSNISASNSELKMTSELYSKLKADQEEFHSKLLKLIEECAQSIVMKELMILNGAQKSPRWLKAHLKKFLIDGIVKSNGVISLIQAVCEDTCESGTSWEKLDVVARLIAASHGNSEEYYNSVCSQLLEILTSKSLKYGATIANSCISALYQFNPVVCIRKIFRVIAEPLLIKPNNEELLKTEEEVTNCIETLSKCFLSTEAEFKTLPAKLMLEISIPLFHLHVKAAKSISAYREKIRQLLLKILSDESTKEITFSAFLDHEMQKSESTHFGNKLSFEFGPTGGFKITGKAVDLDHEELSDCIFNLVQSDEPLASSLFNYLLKSLAKFRNVTEKDEILENEIDTIERVGKQLAAIKLLSRLSNTKIVQDAQIKNPRPLLSFVKSLFEETRLKRTKGREYNEDDAFDILYVSLMLVKVILSEREKPLNWEPFEEFSRFLGKEKSSGAMPEHVISLVNEILNIVRTHSTPQRFYDLSADAKRESDFDKALKDLADPLLPVRAHGIISLTKLVESSNPDVIAKRDVLIYLFQENLKHEDSFIYLAAVNGVCALAMHFPQKVVEILVQEFIDMPQRSGSGEITPETRAKLGEILMKTTRSLGEMAPKYKSLLVNAFLCGTRDPDPLVRSSSLSCLGELCKVLGFRVGNLITEILYCIGCIIKSDKEYQCRRAGVLVATLLLRGLGKEMLTSLGSDLVVLYRGLKHLRDNDEDSVLRLHAQLALEEFDDVVQNVLFAKPKLEKTLFLLHD